MVLFSVTALFSAHFYLPPLSLSLVSELLAVEVIGFGANPTKLIRLQVAFTPAGKRSLHCRDLDGLLEANHPH